MLLLPSWSPTYYYPVDPATPTLPPGQVLIQDYLEDNLGELQEYIYIYFKIISHDSVNNQTTQIPLSLLPDIFSGSPRVLMLDSCVVPH